MCVFGWHIAGIGRHSVGATSGFGITGVVSGDALKTSEYSAGLPPALYRGSRSFTGDQAGVSALRELDVKDREILEILSKEARVALKALAARVGLSRSATSERVLQLERSGVIRGYRADIGEIDANVIRAIILVALKRTPALGLLDRTPR